jgi:hypothetical protein
LTAVPTAVTLLIGGIDRALAVPAAEHGVEDREELFHRILRKGFLTFCT